MTRIKILGLVIGASLILFGSAEATPIVVQARVHHGVAIRTTRRHVRRAYY
jgi:hypothetical protein